MNRNLTSVILIILAIGLYFTFTKAKVEELKSIQEVNNQYKKALENSNQLVKTREKVQKDFNKISEEDRAKLEKMIPDNIDNIRLIIDINGIAERNGLIAKGIKTNVVTESAIKNTDIKNQEVKSSNSNSKNPIKSLNSSLETVTISFGVTTSYQNFLNFLQDLELSLRVLDISKITLKANDNGIYDYGLELKTYWLKQ